jgi:hypothetical protein
VLRKGDVLVVPSSAIKHRPGILIGGIPIGESTDGQIGRLRIQARDPEMLLDGWLRRWPWSTHSYHPDGGLETGKAPANETAHISGMELQR